MRRRYFNQKKTEVYILDSEYKLWKPEDYNNVTSRSAGVAIINGEHSFVLWIPTNVYKLDSTYGMGKYIPQVSYTNNKDELKTLFNGVENTSIIVNTDKNGSNAAYHCYRYPLLGKRGYLADGGEWNLVLENIDEINEIYKVKLISHGLLYFKTFWTSAQYESNTAWYVDITKKDFFSAPKSAIYSYFPFFKLPDGVTFA